MVAPAILRRPEVERMVGLKRSSIYRLMAEGRFPAAIKIGERARAWRVRDIEAWLETRDRASYGPQAGA